MFGLYLRTLSKLKPVQFIYRIKYLVKRRIVQWFSAWIDQHYECKAVRAPNASQPLFQLAHGYVATIAATLKTCFVTE